RAMMRIVMFILFAGAAFGQTRARLAEYALVLEDPPVAERVRNRAALHSEESQSHLRKIRAAQSGVLSELARRKVRVVSTAGTLVNAVFVYAAAEQAAELEGIPGVKRVQYLPPA